ncbi:MAG: hypothetical protein B7Z47_04920 [Chthoniobacter sp. 12-60-6]|nr:MAG: hypothetical protein B7Z47_04920 [Chthoniobacter sp. 12-60-6]
MTQHPPTDVELLTRTLRDNRVRFISIHAVTFGKESGERADLSTLESIQKNLPLLLDELTLLLPDVMKGDANLPPIVAGSIDCRAEHRLDVVIKILTGICETVVLEISRLNEFVADEFLSGACREVRRFFDVKIASYSLQFVEVQKAELALHASQLQEANQRLLDASQCSKAVTHSRLQLLQGVTHELRNSLQAVLLYATSLADAPGDSGSAEVAERLAVNAIHLQKLLDRLQTYSAILSGEMKIELGLVDLAQFLSDLEQRHCALAKAAQTRLIFKQTGGPATITTDLNKLNMIADNLVGNAIHSARSGLVQVEISDDGPGRFLLKVVDDGVGLSLTEARHIFRVMHHVSGSHFPGLKLGLLASRYLTHVLGGEITFESEVGHGASFILALPKLSPKP